MKKIFCKMICLPFWLFLLLAGCVGSTDDSKVVQVPGAKRLVNLTDEQSRQREAALVAKKELGETLLRELMQAMIQPPLGSAIKICQERAPAVAGEVSQKHGLKIGRTSFKLRNQANQPPEWAKSFVAEKTTEEVCVSLPDNQLGVLIPIQLQNTCLMCHGKQISNDLKAVIVTHYPDDQATGFEEGDLRGYFWLEVPAVKP
jgi:nitrate reductase cytochrome c-type subunit